MNEPSMKQIREIVRTFSNEELLEQYENVMKEVGERCVKGTYTHRRWLAIHEEAIRRMSN